MGVSSTEPLIEPAGAFVTVSSAHHRTPHPHVRALVELGDGRGGRHAAERARNGDLVADELGSRHAGAFDGIELARVEWHRAKSRPVLFTALRGDRSPR